MKQIIKKYWVEFLLACVLLVAYNQWIFHFGYLTHGDWWFHHREFLQGFFNLPQIWNSYISFGLIEVMPNFNFFKFIYGVISQFFDYSISERVIYFWPIILFSYIGIIKLGRYIFKDDDNGLFFFSILFLFNTYTLSLQTGFNTYACVYALSPLALYCFIKTFGEESFRLKYIILCSLLLFICSLYEIRALIALYIFLSGYCLFILFDNKSKILNITARFISICLIFILLNVYLFPTFVNLGSTDIPSTQNLFIAFNSITDSISLHIYAWQGNIFSPFTFVAFQKVVPSFYFFIVTILGFGALIFVKTTKIENKKFILFLSLSSLLGIFLLKQQNVPFGIFYEFAFKHIPLFNLFRESNKFIINLMLPFSLLFGFSASILLLKVTNKLFKSVLFLFLSSLILINLKPILSQEIGTLFIQKYVPSDYLIFKDFILKQPDYFRTLWTPTYSRWSIYTNTHPEVSVINAIQSNWGKLAQSKYDKIPEDQIIVQILKQTFSNSLLDASSIKYVVVPVRDIANNDDFFYYYGNNRFFYINVLDKLDYLQKIDIGTKELAVYENKDYRPHVYLTNEIETTQKEVPYTKVDFKFINPTEYKVSLKNLSGPVYLNFSEAFNANWKIWVGDFNWWDVLLKKDYFLADSIHQKNDAGLNSFLINPNGRKDLELTLYFRPQSYFYLGLIISGITLFICLGFLVYTLINGARRNRSRQRAG